MDRNVSLLLNLAFATLTSLAARAESPQKRPEKDFRVCGHKFRLEIADTPESRRIGLMHRNEVPKDRGMLFVFRSEEPLSFWMKNVPFDIDIAFFDAKGRYVSGTTMKGTSPLQKTEALPMYPSAGPSLYAVEMTVGFLSKLKTKDCRLDPLPKPAAL